MLRADDWVAYTPLRTIPGVGNILALTLFYEIHDVARFPKVGIFLSYCRLVPGRHDSDGKVKAAAGRTMGNANLRWALSESAVFFPNGYRDLQGFLRRLHKKHGRNEALGVLAAKLGRAVYFMLKRRVAFDTQRFLRV